MENANRILFAPTTKAIVPFALRPKIFVFQILLPPLLRVIRTVSRITQGLRLDLMFRKNKREKRHATRTYKKESRESKLKFF